jgi:membrane-associated protein
MRLTTMPLESASDDVSHWGICGARMRILTTLSHMVLHFYFAHQVAALFTLVLIEEAGIPIPIPGDTLVMLAGARYHKTLGYEVTMLLASSLAVFIGSSLLFFVMRRKGRPLLEKYGKYIRLNRGRLDMLERWFVRRGRLAIILGRLIPGLRIPTTIMAGLADVPYSVYAPTAALAAVIWSLFYFWVGVALLHGWQLISAYAAGLLDDLTGSIVWVWLFVLLCVSGGTLHVGWRLWRVRARRHATTILDGARSGPLPAARGAEEPAHVGD